MSLNGREKRNAFICDFETYQLKCHVVLFHGNRAYRRESSSNACPYI